MVGVERSGVCGIDEREERSTSLPVRAEQSFVFVPSSMSVRQTAAAVRREAEIVQPEKFMSANKSSGFIGTSSFT